MQCNHDMNKVRNKYSLFCMNKEISTINTLAASNIKLTIMSYSNFFAMT